MFIYIHSVLVCTPPPFCVGGWGKGVEPPTNQIFKKGGGVDRTSSFREGVTFFRGGGVAIFTPKKIKSEIFNDKKSL